MSGFLYFLPAVNQGNVNFAVLQEYGLAHIVDTPKQHLIHRGCSGPDSSQGVIVGVGDRWDFGQVKNSPAITWKRFPKTVGPEGLSPWLGYVEADGLPTPDQLKRSHEIPGEFLSLADGCNWLVPIARDIEGNCRLPIAFDLDDETGEWVTGNVRKEYAKIWNHAISYYTALTVAALAAREANEPTFKFDIPDGEARVVDALATNYRVSARELATLGVLSTGIVQQVADVLCDWGDSAKKKLVDNSGIE